MSRDFEAWYRLVFLACVAALFLLERVPALQHRSAPGTRRWTANAGLFVIASIIGGLVLPLGLYALAERTVPGPIARLGLPLAAEVVLVFVLLDLWKYWEHRLLHRVPWLWRMHLVHHSDTAVDVTTTERHHPLEVVVSTGLMVALVVGLGLPAVALGAYLMVATVVALYSHSNLRLPWRLDVALSRVLVTAPVHAVHHSDVRAETDSNYGAVLTLWDRLFGTYVDPRRARVPHFGLEYFHQPADTRLRRVLLQPFVFRPGAPYPQRIEAPDASPARGASIAPATGRAWLAGVASIVAVIAVTWPTLAEMTSLWSNTEAYQYAWLVLPVFAYLLAQPEARQHALEPRPGLAGIIAVAFAATGWAVATLASIDALRALCLVLMLQGVALATLGATAYRRLFPIFALLFFMVPCGDLLQPALRALTLESMDRFCTLAGMPHTVDGFVLHVEGRRYVVVEECAGLTYVTLATFLGYCFALLLRRSFAAAAAMALLGAGLGIASNVARVNAIVLVDSMRGSQMDLAAHGALQWIMLLVALGGLTWTLARARPSPAPGRVAVAPSRAQPRAWMPAAAAGLVAIVVAGAVDLALSRDASRVPLSTASLPRALGEWTLVSPPPEGKVDARARTQLLRATYRHEDRQLDLVVVEALAPEAKLSELAVAPGARTTWREKQASPEAACAPARCVALRHVTWQREHSDDVRHVYFAYDIGGYETSSRLAARFAQGWRRLRGDAVDARLAALDSQQPLAAGELADAWRDLRTSIVASGALRIAGEHAAQP